MCKRTKKIKKLDRSQNNRREDTQTFQCVPNAKHKSLQEMNNEGLEWAVEHNPAAVSQRRTKQFEL